MRNILITLLLLSLSTVVFSQVNYLQLRDHFTVTCGKIDSTDLVKNKQFLDSLAHFEIIEGEEQFLYDIGFTYYRMYGKTHNESDLLLSSKYNQACWDKFQNPYALWNLGMNCSALGECEKSIELTELYITTMKEQKQEEYIDYQQVYLMYKHCRN